MTTRTSLESKSFAELITGLSISQTVISIAFGTSPDLFQRLEGAGTMEECLQVLELSPKYHKLKIAVIEKMIGMITSGESLQEFRSLRTRWGGTTTSSQRPVLKEKYQQYMPAIIAATDDTNGLENILDWDGFLLDDEIKKGIEGKIFELWATKIVQFETVPQCKECTIKNKRAEKLCALRLHSILLRMLENATTSAEVLAAMTYKSITTSVYKQGEVRLSEILWKEIDLSDTFEESMRIYYQAKRRGWKRLEHCALVKACKKAETRDELKTAHQCFENRSKGVRMRNRILGMHSQLIVREIADATDINQCFSIYARRLQNTEAIIQTLVDRVFEIADALKTTEAYLHIHNLLKGKESSCEGLNLRDRARYALDVALYYTNSLEDWRMVWWREKGDQEFQAKCLRRLKAWCETRDGHVDLLPIVDGLYVILPADAA